MKIITVTLAPNQAVLNFYLQDKSPEMPNAAIRPAMLVVPGGGYQYCSDREGEPVALAYMAQGFNAVVLRYTAAETIPIDKALQDGAAAMDYLRANAAELEIDPQQIAAVGFSAGGHLVASLGTLLPKAQRPNALVLGYAATLGAMWTVVGRQEPDLHALVDDVKSPGVSSIPSPDESAADGIGVHREISVILAARGKTAGMILLYRLHMFRVHFDPFNIR